MAGKEKKAAAVRQLTLVEKDKSLLPGDTPKRRSGRQLGETKVKNELFENVKRVGRPRKKFDPPTPPVEDPKTPQKSGRKNFLEKELEDILENATGRNTPSIGPREVEDDASSSRTFSNTFLRTRRPPEMEDDLQLKVPKDDDDNSSVRSLSLKKTPGRKTKLLVDQPVAKGKVAKPKKGPVASSKIVPIKKVTKKVKDVKKVVKKPLKAIQNKIGAKRRSNFLINKKVKNAQIAVKRIYRKKNCLKTFTQLKESTDNVNGEMIAQDAKINVPSTATAKKRPSPKGTQVKKAVFKKKSVVTEEMGTRDVDPAIATASIGSTGKKVGRKRRAGADIIYETKQSPHDSSVIIVQPRLGPKARKISKIIAETEPSISTPVVQSGVSTSISPSVSIGPSSPAGTSTPYFIQAMPNFSSLKSQTNVQGDWLVTPTGVVLIQAMPQVERSPRVENPEPMSTSLTPAAPLPASVSAPDSMLSEEAKEAEPALDVALPVIPVAKNNNQLVMKSHTQEAAGSQSTYNLPTIKAIESVDFCAKSVASERRASHDGSFGLSPPSRLLRRTGSCDRLGAKSPRSILQLGCEPLFLNEAVKGIETDSSFSLPLPRRVRSGELPSLHLAVVMENIGTEQMDVEPAETIPKLTGSNPIQFEDSIISVVVEQTKSEKASKGKTEELTEPKTLEELKPSGNSQIKEVDDNEVKRALNELLDCVTSLEKSTEAEKKSPLVEPSPDVIIQIRAPTPATTTIVVPLTIPHPSAQNGFPQRAGSPIEPPAKRCPKDDSRNSNRAKKYSRSLDSRQKLLPGLRRRSHPEPRVINIVTCEDGTRQGRALVDELRLNQQIVKVPYPASTSSSPLSPPKSSSVDTPRDTVCKETFLSALGLRSLEDAAKLEEQKKKQQLMKQKQILQQQQQREREQQLAAVNNNYTGTLKTVIKIQRPEKKGNGRMIYKASSAGNNVEPAQIEEEATTDSGGTKESHESGDDESKNSNGKAKALVIPEKASSFSIHPQRLCSDVCTYCFGKFGLLDTPCHIAQLKDGDKRRNILTAETHLTLDSCLCDACFRHVDKKSNCPSFTEKKTISKRKLMPRKQSICCAVGCDLEGKHNIRRKLLYKMKKSLAKKLSLDHEKIEEMIPVHLVSLCNRHIYWVDYFMSCGICNKRLNVHNMHRVGTEVMELNPVLSADGIPAVLTDKRFLCKMCQCYTSIRSKVKDPSEMSSHQRQIYDTCRRKILQEHGIEVPDSEVEGDDEISPKNGKPVKTGKKLKTSATVTNGISEEVEVSVKADSVAKPGRSSEELSDLRARFKPLPQPADGEFHKCSSTIQFTKETKNLFYELQRPYGNHSSFFRHLILIEKYFRSGDLVLSRKADQQAVRYVNGVNNRLRSYEGAVKTNYRPFTLTPVPSSSSTPIPSTSARPPTPVSSPLSQMQATVQSIGLKPEISITSVPQEPRKLTPKIQENLRALANRSGKSTSSPTRAVILNRTVGGQKQSLVQVTTGGKTIHLTLAQFRRIQQMQLRKKQILEQQKKGKGARTNGPEEHFPNIPKALSVSVTKVPSVDLTKSPTRLD